MNIIGNEKSNRKYDAIVIGSGISGGWAAKELCEKGLKTLLLERGRNVEHVKDYPTANYHPWDFKFGIFPSNLDEAESPIQSLCADSGNKHFFVSDREHPYIQEQPFNWIRGYQVGGRSLVWGRQCYRLSDLDFEANAKEGIGVDWPIRYRDIAPWYDYAERFIGVAGTADGLKQLPDGNNYLPPFELNCIEAHLAQSMRTRDERKRLVIARVANLTKPWNGRGSCLNRNLCSRGCPYGGYFSSNSATLPAAAATGNLTLYPNAIVSEVLYDDSNQQAYGVRVVDAISMEVTDYYARIIFLNASTIATTAILLNSTSSRFPDGLGNDSGELGRNLMDHHSYAGAYGEYKGFADKYYKGRRPCGFIIPRFRNLSANEKLPFVRGYNMQGHGERQEWQERAQALTGFGAAFKDQLTKPGPWTIWMGGWGECLPYRENRVTLDHIARDRWGLPLVKISFSYRTNEFRMMEDIEHTAGQLLEDAGFVDIYRFNYPKAGGSTVHEMGTARMGHDPNTSVLNKFNQIHTVKNVFVTDGSCMTSSASQNPSLTYMALTARACHVATEGLKNGDF